VVSWSYCNILCRAKTLSPASGAFCVGRDWWRASTHFLTRPRCSQASSLLRPVGMSDPPDASAGATDSIAVDTAVEAAAGETASVAHAPAAVAAGSGVSDVGDGAAADPSAETVPRAETAPRAAEREKPAKQAMFALLVVYVSHSRFRPPLPTNYGRSFSG
jgi:hypothetical protein